MFITTITILILIGAALKPIRGSLYILHLGLVTAASWGIEQEMGVTEPFTRDALFWFLILHLFSANMLVCIAYGYDKNASVKKTWRVPERVLQGFALIGGTLGAYLGQRIWRHKTKKKRFQVGFWLILLFQYAAIVVFASS